MDYEKYRETYFVEPQPEEKFEFAGIRGACLYLREYEAAIEFYSNVLGPPNYIENEETHGWKLGNTWLTLFPGSEASPGNISVEIQMKSAEEADRLQATFIEAGARGASPSDEFRYDPIRFCPVTDPFGTELLIFSLSQT
jgi:uncharacterized glyoxalase superfamily protein PhnB